MNAQSGNYTLVVVILVNLLEELVSNITINPSVFSVIWLLFLMMMVRMTIIQGSSCLINTADASTGNRTVAQEDWQQYYSMHKTKDIYQVQNYLLSTQQILVGGGKPPLD